MLISVENHGPLIMATNYWDSELAPAGKLWVSVNAGAIRVLLPPARYQDLADMRAAEYCILSRGPWPDQFTEAGSLPGPRYIPEAVEIVWDDHSDAPYAIHLTPESFDVLPAEPAPGREWVLTAWTAKDGKPHKALERVCHWRRVPKIPWLKPWEVAQ